MEFTKGMIAKLTDGATIKYDGEKWNPVKEEHDEQDILVFLGGACKAMGDGKIGGHLCLYSEPNEPDLYGDFFSKKTDFDLDDESKVRVLYEHGMDPVLDNTKLGVKDGKTVSKASVKKDKVGVWIEHQLDMRDKYQAAIYEMVEAGALGWSSGVPAHLTRRSAKGTNQHVDAWPISEASLTVQPAEPRTLAVALKSLPKIEDSPLKKLADRKAESFEEIMAELQEIKEGQQQLAARLELFTVEHPEPETPGDQPDQSDSEDDLLTAALYDESAIPEHQEEEEEESEPAEEDIFDV